MRRYGMQKMILLYGKPALLSPVNFMLNPVIPKELTKEWKARQADFKIENIRFVHGPDWNKRTFSIQAAHDGGTSFWRATRTIMFFGGFSV